MIQLRTGLPSTVTRDQTRLICDILGLPSGDVIAFSSDAKYGVSADLVLRTEEGRIATGYNGEPLTSTVELVYDEAASLPTSSPSSYCAPTITARVRELEPTEDGWIQGENTGQVCVVCPCGLVTGWMRATEAKAIYEAHVRPKPDTEEFVAGPADDGWKPVRQSE